MKKLQKQIKIPVTLALVVGVVCLFFFYIHATKEKVVTALALEEANGAVTVNIQNPYIMPIKVYKMEVIDDQDNLIPAKTYSIILAGLFNHTTPTVPQSHMLKKTQMFEELNEVTIKSDSASKEESYILYLESPNEAAAMHRAEKITISFKVFSLIPFRTTVYV